MFAALCVLLASLGHVMMSGTPVPWWAMAAGALATGGTAWALAGRERGPLAVVSLTVAAQVALHAAFSFAQVFVHPVSGGSLGTRWLEHMLCGAVPGTGAATPHVTPGGGHAAHTMEHAAHTMNHASHGMDHGAHAMPGMPMPDAPGMAGAGDLHGMSPTGMLLAHLLAALVCGLWLAHGERAAFRILRAAGNRLFAPLRLLLRPPAPAHKPRVRRRRSGVERWQRGRLLIHTITSRGPPVGTAVA
nr:hypothetical protein [Streptomyces sp.]